MSAVLELAPDGPSPRRRFWSRLGGNTLAVASLVWIAILLVCFVWPELLATHDPAQTDVTLTHVFEGPSAEHWLGTDGDGRDLYSRVVFGGQLAVASILIAMAIAVGVGVPIGMWSGWRGGRVDRAVMWFNDVLFSLPIVLLAMAVITVLAPSLTSAMIGIGIALTTRFVRLTRAVTLAEREELYVDAARISGLTSPTILRRYILPNLLPPLIVQFAVLAGAVVLIGASLSFLGIGANLQDPDWGVMLNAARSRFRSEGFWQIVPPGGALVLTVLAFNLLGDAIGDAVGRDSTTNALTASRPRRTAPATTPHADSAVLSVRDLRVEFPAPGGGAAEVLSGVSLDIAAGETVGLVGESGSGKSMTVLAALGLTPAPGQVTAGSVRFDGADVTELSERAWSRIRGDRVGVIFQEPVAALNPALKIGDQIAEPLRRHAGLDARTARARAIDLLEEVRVPDPARRIDEYPHQMSGGMAQRVGIAVALACEPELLIADEPTTALDVTVQGQILDLLADIQRRRGMAILLITHDLGVVAEIADRVVVMYAGQVVEEASATDLFRTPRHPYTRALLATMPQAHGDTDAPLRVIPGVVPPATAWPAACRFAPRCEHAEAACRDLSPVLERTEHGAVRCLRAGELAAVAARDADPSWSQPQ